MMPRIRSNVFMILVSGIAGAGVLAQPAHGAAITTITLSRSGGDAVADSSLTLTDGVTPAGYGSTASSNVGTIVYQGHYYYTRAIIHFDLSKIPAHATIQSATLAFHANGGLASTNIYRLTHSFAESTATWQYRSGTTAWDGWASSKDQDRATTATSASTGAAANTPSYDVTSDVQLFVNGTENDGWVIIGPETGSPASPPKGSSTDLLYLNENGKSTEPVLTINYTVPEPASLGLLGVSGLMLLRRKRK
jgi:hypothetical protein